MVASAPVYKQFIAKLSKVRTLCNTPLTLCNIPKTLCNTPNTLRNTPLTVGITPRTLRNTPETLRNTPWTLRNTPRTLRKAYNGAWVLVFWGWCVGVLKRNKEINKLGEN